MREHSPLSIVLPISRNNNLTPLKATLDQCFELNLQIVIVHDVQDLTTGPSLIQLLANYPNLQIIFKEGKFGNPGSARNFGKSLANSPWVAFWDSDDFPSPCGFLSLVESNFNSDTEVIIGSYRVVNMNDNKILRESTLSKNNSNELTKISVDLGIWRFIFRKEIITNIDFPPLLMGEDLVFIAKVSLPNLRVKTSEEIIYSYVVGDSSQLTRQDKALRTIPRSNEFLRDIYSNDTSPSNRRFVLSLLMRQILSGIVKKKYSPFSQEIYKDIALMTKNPSTLFRVLKGISKRRLS
jgi:glycosyltransferase involved in cell wall biosynthesis